MLPVRNARERRKALAKRFWSFVTPVAGDLHHQTKNGPTIVAGPYCFCESQERRNLTLVKKEEKKKRFLLRLLFYDEMRTLAVRRDYADTTQNLRL
jgi:hypothetical protein